MSDVMYLPEVAKRLGKTDEAVRQHIKKRSNAIPPFIRVGGRICFRVKDYETWLDSFVIENQPKKRGY